jgi:hypothetical protein
MTRSGKLVASFVSPDFAPWVFDTLGAPLRRLTLANGFGPDYRGPTNVALLPGDSIAVLDNGASVLFVFNEAGVPVRSVAINLAFSAYSLLALPGGKWVVEAPVESPDAVGYPLHLLSRTGRVVRSFGSKTGDFRRDAAVPQPSADSRGYGRQRMVGAVG